MEDQGRHQSVSGVSQAPHGFVAYGDDAWLVDRTDSVLYHYLVPDFGPLIRDPSKDFDLDSANTAAVGGCTDGTRIWIGDNGDHKAYAYSITDGSRLSAYDATFNSANQNATSLGTDGNVLWVADSADTKVYTYTITSGSMPHDSTKDFDSSNVFATWFCL